MSRYMSVKVLCMNTVGKIDFFGKGINCWHVEHLENRIVCVCGVCVCVCGVCVCVCVCVCVSVNPKSSESQVILCSS